MQYPNNDKGVAVMLTPNLPKKLLYKRIPVRLNESDFIQFVIPYLSNGSRFGPKQKISSYKMFNYISYVMHTGCQWYSLRSISSIEIDTVILRRIAMNQTGISQLRSTSHQISVFLA